MVRGFRGEAVSNATVFAAVVGFVVSGGAAALPSLLADAWQWLVRDRRPLRSDGCTQDGHHTLVSLARRMDPCRVRKPTLALDELP